MTDFFRKIWPFGRTEKAPAPVERAVHVGRPRLFLHMGTHRTATTSTQAVIRHNIERLKEMGYLSPFGVGRQLGEMNAIFNGRATPEKIAQRILAEIRDCGHPIHTVLISDEAISLQRDASALAAFSRHFDLKVIFNLRRQDLWLESWWSQNVKSQWDPKLANKDFESFIRDRADFHWAHYDQRVSLLEDWFGAENVMVDVFESHAMPDGPVSTFFRKVGIDSIDGFHIPKDPNPSMTPMVSEIMRRMPIHSATHQHRRTIMRACEQADAQARKTGQPKLILPHDQRLAIMAEYEAGNTALARRRFGRDRLFLDPLPDASEPVADLALPESGDEMMALFLRPFVKGLVDSERRRVASEQRAARKSGTA